MAGSSSCHGSTSSSVAEPTFVRIVQTNRNPDLWSHFDMCEMSNDSRRARCKMCGKYLASESNSTLRVHLTKHCKSLRNNPAQDQAQMSNDGGVWNFNVDMVRERMAQFVIQETLPFDHFDNPRLTKLIQDTLQPRYHHVSRTTLRNDCLKMWKKAKIELINGFQNLNTGVSLTTDVWSAPHGLPESYLCVTAHWIEQKTWKMMKRTIAFELFGYPHSGNNLFYIFDHVVQTFGLQPKLFATSFDNASNNTNAVDKLKLKYQLPCEGKFFHGRCIAHIINLVVQDGLNETKIQAIVNSFRTMLREVFSYSKKRYMNYRKFCRETDSPFLGPNWDVPTRWNSTWKMFDSAIRQRNSLQVFHNDLFQHRKVAEIFPGSKWEVIEKLTGLLVVFKNATTFLSGVYYPTSPWILQQLYLMCNKLNDFEFQGQLYEDMIGPMREKFTKYFRELSPIITCAAALNPCNNVAGVETLIDSIVFDLKLTESDPMCATLAKASFNKDFQNIYDHYLTKYGPTTQMHQSLVGSSSSSVGDPLLNLYNVLKNENSKRARGSTPSSELGRYMGTDFVSTLSIEEIQNFDLLAWWKLRESQFPILAAMARDILSVQASTVASESAFSVSGRVLSIRRTRLTPQSVETCICLKDHLDAAERIQNVATLEEELNVEEEIHTYEVSRGAAAPLSDEEQAYDESQRQSSGDE